MKIQMKKTLSVLLSIVMLASLFGGLSLPASAEEVLEIGSVEDWDRFVNSFAWIGESYSGKTVRLTADVGTAGQPVTTGPLGIFSGTFDGCGHTLTMAIGNSSESNALFSTIQNAVIQNLTLAGTVVKNSTPCAALASDALGQCSVSNVLITANVVTGASIFAGVILKTGGSSTITVSNTEFAGCLAYTGKQNNSLLVGGFFGRVTNRTDTPRIHVNDCVFSGSCSGVRNFNPIGFNNNQNSSFVTANVTNMITGTPNRCGADYRNLQLYSVTGSTSKLFVREARIVDAGGGETYYNTFADACAAWADGGTLVLLDDAELDSVIEAPGGSAALDLHGHGLLGTDHGSVISVPAQTKLTLTDSVSTALRRITLDDTGRGVAADTGHGTESDTLKNVTGGFITGGNNQTGNGGGIVVGAGGTLDMTGGTVTGNVTAGSGGGVYVEDADAALRFGGTCVVQQNRAGTAENNAAINGNPITFSGPLSAESRIGVTMATPGVFTSGMGTNAVRSNFTSDDPAWAVGVNASGEAYLDTAYSVTYDANGATGGDVPVDENSPYVPGDTVTVMGNTGNLENTGYTFDGWNTEAGGTGGTAYAAGDTFTASADTVLYAQWKAEVVTQPPYAVGDVFEFGMYPQTEVTEATDAETYAALNALTPEWHSFGYSSGTATSESFPGKCNGEMTEKDFWKFADVEYAGVKYRAVRSEKYRPYDICFPENETGEKSNQYYYGYHPGTVYWFRYEPLRWRVLDPAAGLAICETVIDSQPFHNYVLYRSGYYYGDAAGQYNVNDYSHSSLRAWLNGTFLNTAFSAAQQNAIASTELTDVSVTDKLFPLSRSDVQNTAWFANAAARNASGSDYAKSQGLYVYANNMTNFWWLRMASTDEGAFTAAGASSSYFTDVGVRPAMTVDLNAVAAAEFTAYKETRKTDAGKLGQEGDPAACEALIAQAQAAIGAMEYDVTVNLAGNKQAVDAALAQLNSALADARLADYAEYQTAQKNAAAAMKQEDDSAACEALIAQAVDDIEARSYDAAATPAANKLAVDDIVAQLAADLAAQRAAEQLAADQAAADAVEALIAAIGTVEYTDECKAKIDAAKDAYDLLTDTRKALVDPDAVTALNDASAAYALLENKAAFADYKESVKTLADGMKNEGDSDACTALVEAAKEAVDAVNYDDNKSLDENKDAVDNAAALTQLAADLAAQRAAEADDPKEVFEEYRATLLTLAQALRREGDSEAVTALIDEAVAALTGYVYDDAKTLAENEDALSEVLALFANRIKSQRRAERQEALNHQPCSLCGEHHTGSLLDNFIGVIHGIIWIMTCVALIAV